MKYVPKTIRILPKVHLPKQPPRRNECILVTPNTTGGAAGHIQSPAEPAVPPTLTHYSLVKEHPRRADRAPGSPSDHYYINALTFVKLNTPPRT
jgi:hypothetical protein